MGKTYQVQVISLKEDKKTIDVANTEAEFNNTTVAAFKEKLMEKFPDIKVETFILVFTDKPLEDEKTFSTYGIQHASVIRLILRMPGGGSIKLMGRRQ